MMTRPLFKTPGMVEQHHILTEVSVLIDNGLLQTTLTENSGPWRAIARATA
jgi:hypothetical protein